MRFDWRVFLMAILLLTVALPAAAQDETSLIITNVWARPTAAGMDMAEGDEMAMSEDGEMDMAEGEDMEMSEDGEMGMGGTSAVYMTITNPTMLPVTLTAAATDVAAITEIHETSIEDEVARMRPLMDGLTVNPGETVTLEPGGFHVMLMDLSEPLEPEDAFTLNLIFETEDEEMAVRFGVPVMDIPPLEPTVNVNSASVWARPTTDEPMEMAMSEDGDMDMAEGEDGDMDMEMSDMGTSAVYMMLSNPGDTEDALIAASTDVAGIVEIHETIVTDEGVGQMRPVDGGITVPEMGGIVLEPGGFHIMLMDLQQDLNPGETITLTLEFASGDTITIAAPVEDRMMMGMN